MLERYGHAAWASAEQPAALDQAVMNTFGQWQTAGTLDSQHAARHVVPTRRRNAEQLAAVLADVLDGREAAPSRSPQRGYLGVSALAR